MAVLIETSIGDLVIDLYTSQRPKTCLRFLKRCKTKVYNFSLFHNVQTSFVAEICPSGTAASADSEGGSRPGGESGESLELERELSPTIKHSKLGTVSMSYTVKCPTSNFFFTLRANLAHLDAQHCVFGEVAEGLDVLQKLNTVAVDKNNRPLQDILVLHTIVLDDPFDDPGDLIVYVPSRSPSPPTNLTDANHIGVDEVINEFECKTVTEVEEAIALRESKANAQILEMVGDIPDADAKPLENVLFVCKLNPSTSSEDLEIIFSRFGPITSCKVIRDQKTGVSHQYAFIGFESVDDCEKAYFKMNNVLIDDRRIHVDFSQSLAVNKKKKRMRIKRNSNRRFNRSRSRTPKRNGDKRIC